MIDFDTTHITWLADEPTTCCPWCGDYLQRAVQVVGDRETDLPRLDCPSCPTSIHLTDFPAEG